MGGNNAPEETTEPECRQRVRSWALGLEVIACLFSQCPGGQGQKVVTGGHGGTGGQTPMQGRGGHGGHGGVGGQKVKLGQGGTGGKHGGHGGVGGQMLKVTTVGQQQGGGAQQSGGPKPTEPVLNAVNKIKELMVRNPRRIRVMGTASKQFDVNAQRGMESKRVEQK